MPAADPRAPKPLTVAMPAHPPQELQVLRDRQGDPLLRFVYSAVPRVGAVAAQIDAALATYHAYVSQNKAEQRVRARITKRLTVWKLHPLNSTRAPCRPSPT